MWVFGHGSLLWDRWETTIGCLRRVPAELPRHARSFNKASVKNWGTRQHPGPTLNLVAHDTQSCKGIAFEFPDEKRIAVLQYLSEREGKGFELREHRIHLEAGEQVSAFVPVYCGTNHIDDRSIEQRARMVLAARGRSGDCYEYVKNIVDKLAELKIEDPEVAEFWRAVQSER